MGRTMTYTETLEVTRCWCGIALAIPTNLLRHAHDDGQSVYCPLGHQFSWRETEADRLRTKLERAESQREREANRARAERDLREDTERRLAAQKGATTRAKNRHAAGVCPGCKRSFVQLRRHMEAKHPELIPHASLTVSEGSE